MQNRSFSSSRSDLKDDVDKNVDEEQLRTLWCGGISDKVDEEILYELFQNAGPLERVVIPKDKETKRQKNFAFIVFQHAESTQYAYDLLNGTELFRQPIRLQNKETGLGICQITYPGGASLIAEFYFLIRNGRRNGSSLFSQQFTVQQRQGWQKQRPSKVIFYSSWWNTVQQFPRSTSCLEQRRRLQPRRWGRLQQWRLSGSLWLQLQHEWLQSTAAVPEYAVYSPE